MEQLQISETDQPTARDKNRNKTNKFTEPHKDLQEDPIQPSNTNPNENGIDFDKLAIHDDIMKSNNLANGKSSLVRRSLDLSNKPKYLVTKGYNAKKKDELQLQLGTEVYVLNAADDRSFVIVVDRKGDEIARGWIPSFSIQRKEDAKDLQSKEGLIFLIYLVSQTAAL